MAKRRMFSTEIIESDAFLSLPLKCQNLYIHLMMNTDDDGVVSNAVSLAKILNCNAKNLETLVKNKFLLEEKSKKIFIIKHFFTQNQIRADRKKASNYSEILAKYRLNDIKAYELIEENDNHLTTICQPNDNQMTTKCRHNIIQSNLIQFSKTEDDKSTYVPSNEILKKLLHCRYIDADDVKIMDYSQFVEMLIKNYGYKDTCVKIDYFIEQVCLQDQEGRWKFGNELNIENKFAYFKKSVEQSFRRI